MISKHLSQTIKYILESGVDPVNQFASQAHEKWRAGWREQNGGKDVPRIKKNSDGTEGDINQPFNKIHPDWKKENLDAGNAALEAVKKHGDDTESAAEHVHNEWMKRNPKAEWNAAQHVPYSKLPEEEKQKDRDHVNIMKSILKAK